MSNEHHRDVFSRERHLRVQNDKHRVLDRSTVNIPAIALALLLGICFLHIQPDVQIPVWTAAELLAFFPFCLFLFYFLPAYRLLISFFIGYLWALMFAQVYWQHGLTDQLEGRDIWVQGVVSGLPESSADAVRFEFTIEKYELPGKSSFDSQAHLPGRVRLSWYYTDKKIEPGDEWRILVRLKRPHGMQNPGGFDYEKWLYQRGIHATGYIRESEQNIRLGQRMWSVDRLRLKLARHISRLHDKQFTGLLQALTVGHKTAISPEQWQVLRNTGTSHLMAISGLHIGLIAGLVFVVVQRLVPVFLLRTFSSHQVAAILTLCAAFLYAMFAGFSLPTQRAFIMLLVVMLAILLKRPAFSLNTLAVSLILVLLVNPLAVLSVGFWLSYLAVLIIMLVSTARVQGKWINRSGFESASYKLIKMLRVQWLIALGMFPVSLMLFQQGALLSPLANMLVIPAVTLLIVPLALLASVFYFIAEDLSLWMFAFTGDLFSYIWMFLEWLSSTNLTSWYRGETPLLLNVLGMLGLGLLLMPRGFPLRLLGGILLVPMLFQHTENPGKGEFWLTVLDVGQGLSVFIQTEEHSLLYDAGAKFSERFDMGKQVILPYLSYSNIARLDKFVISHADNDHAGGAQSVLTGISVDEVYAEAGIVDISSYPALRFSSCHAGDRWQWSGVNFMFLHPATGSREKVSDSYSEGFYKKTNNRSCVLKIWNQQHSVLLTGDIERKIERLLIDQTIDPFRSYLKNDVLIVPHHGSNTSSSLRWLKIVEPQFAIVSAGYKNRFGHPAQKVLERYRQLGAEVLNTADKGAIKIKFSGKETLQQTDIWLQRKASRRYWSHRLP